MIYVIEKTGFCNLENHCPEYTQLLGYVNSEEEGKVIVEELNNSINKYKGWNGKEYPIYKLIKLIKLGV